MTIPPTSQSTQQSLHRRGHLQEQQDQQNRHLQRLEQYRQHPILPSQSHSYVQHPHPYHHPYHVYSHQPTSSSLLPPLPIEHQEPISPAQNIFYSPSPSAWQQLSLANQQQHQQQQNQSQSASSNLQQLFFAENSIPFAGFSVPSSQAWDPLGAGSGSNLLTSPTGQDLFSPTLDASSYFFHTTTSDQSTTHDGTITGTPSPSEPSTLSSRKAHTGNHRSPSRLRVDSRRTDLYRDSGTDNADRPSSNNHSSSSNTNGIMSKNDMDHSQSITTPLRPDEWCSSSAAPAPPLSPLGMVDSHGFQSTLVQSLANLTTSSPNLACLSPPTFSSAFVQNNNPFTYSESNPRSLSISSNHLSGLTTHPTEPQPGDQQDTDNDNDGGDHGNGNNHNNDRDDDNDDSERRFQCPICPKRFLRQYNLNAHLKTHSQVRAHVCTQCDKSFLRPYDLSRHQRIHSNTRPYTCNICQLIFIRNDAIWRHYRRAHPGHPDVPSARRQRRPQRASISLSPLPTTTSATAGDNFNNNINSSSSNLYSSVTSPTLSTSSSPRASSSSSSPSASLAFTSMELYSPNGPDNQS